MLPFFPGDVTDDIPLSDISTRDGEEEETSKTQSGQDEDQRQSKIKLIFSSQIYFVIVCRSTEVCEAIKMHATGKLEADSNIAHLRSRPIYPNVVRLSLVCHTCSKKRKIGSGLGPPWQKYFAWQNRNGQLGRKEIDSLAEKNWKA